MSKATVYLDTSVFSAMNDLRQPERAEVTRAFWERRTEFVLLSSEVARREINDTSDPIRRQDMNELLVDAHVLPLTPAIESLAMQYVRAGFFDIRSLDDALHVAVASTYNLDVLLS